MRKLYLVMAMIISLVGCASAPSAPTISYYLLDEVQTLEPKTNTSRNVAIDQVVMAEYLSLPNLVLKQADHRITLANYHLWAEPLGPSIKRAIISDLWALQPTISFVERCVSCDVISLYVDHFYAQEAGDVVFSGRYSIRRSNGITESQPFSVIEPLKSNGYAAAVQGMRALVRSLAQRIATEL